MKKLRMKKLNNKKVMLMIQINLQIKQLKKFFKNF